MLKKWFIWVYDAWMTKAVATQRDPLVRLMNLFYSSCVYCFSFRIGMVGCGLGLAVGLWSFTGIFLALVLIALAYLLALGEAHWLSQ